MSIRIRIRVSGLIFSVPVCSVGMCKEDDSGEYDDMINKIQGYLELGGLKLLGCKLSDKVTGRNLTNEYIQKIQQAAKPEEYYEILKSLWKMHMDSQLDLDNPQSINEKIQWMKLYDTTPLKTRLADKFLVREWVAEKIGEQYLIPLLGVWNRFDEIDIDRLPDAFVLKCNHGSGMNMVVKDKSEIDWKSVKKKFDAWMKVDFSFVGGLELQYRNIPRRIIAEKNIQPKDSYLLDYKFHIFDGEPKIIQVIGDRDFISHTRKEIFLDINWQPQNLMYHTYDNFETIPKQPDNLDEMLWIAKVLGEEFKYVRVDLYDIEGKIFFGEMTFTPDSGYGKWGIERDGLLFGSWIK